MTRLARQLIPRVVVDVAREVARKLDPHVSLSYSQDGEDMVLRRLLGAQQVGFYVDVGAHHPFRFSNTCHFYRRGWRGINIDADPDAMAAFGRHRPRDVNLSLGIGETEGELTFHRFNEPALNTFDSVLARERLKVPGVSAVGMRSVRVERLESVLARHVPAGTVIDFLSIDVEGLDAAVVASNNWQAHRPRFVLVEVLRVAFEDLSGEPIVRTLAGLGYKPVAKTCNTLILADAQAAAHA